MTSLIRSVSSLSMTLAAHTQWMMSPSSSFTWPRRTLLVMLTFLMTSLMTSLMTCLMTCPMTSLTAAAFSSECIVHRNGDGGIDDRAVSARGGMALELRGMSERARLWEPLVERTLVCFHAHREPTEPPSKLGHREPTEPPAKLGHREPTEPTAKLGRMDHDSAAPTSCTAVSDNAAAAAPPSAAAASAVSGGGAGGGRAHHGGSAHHGAGGGSAGACAAAHCSAPHSVCSASALGPNLEASKSGFVDRLVRQTAQRPAWRLSGGPPDIVAPSTAPSTAPARGRGSNGSGGDGGGGGGGGGGGSGSGAVTGASTSSSSSSSSSSAGDADASKVGDADASTTRLRVWLPRRLNLNISQQYLRFGRQLLDFLDTAKEAVEGAAAGTSLYDPLHASISSEDNSPELRGATLIRNATAIAPPPPAPPALQRSGGGGARHGARTKVDPRSGSLIRKAEPQSPLDMLGALPWRGPEVWLVSVTDCT